MESELSTPRTRRESEVWQACDDLWAHSAQTRNLTGDSIRDQLVKLGYKRGSPNEIYRYRSSWKESRGVIEQGEVAQEGALTSDPISRAVSLVYDQMRTQTNEAMDKLVEDYEAKLKLALIEIEALKNELEKLGGQKSELEQELTFARQRNAALDIALNKEQREQIALVERLKGTNAQLEGIRSEHERLLLELKTFHEREIDLWRAQVSEAQKALAETKRETKAELERQGGKFSEELMQLKTELRQAYEEKALALAKLAAKELAEHRYEALEVLLERQRCETLGWQHKVERLLQRRALRQSERTGSERGRYPRLR